MRHVSERQSPSDKLISTDESHASFFLSSKPAAAAYAPTTTYQTTCFSVLCRLFLSRGADIDIVNREGDTPLSLARVDTPVWVALQINRKLRRGITNRMLRTERIICR